MITALRPTTFLLLALAIITPLVALPAGTTGTSTPQFDYLVIIVLENRGINQTYGNHCAGDCSYITHLANQYSLAEGYSSLTHNSLPNYLAILSGWTQRLQGNLGDCSPLPSSTKYCPNVNPQLTGFPFTTPTIIDRLESTGKTWKAYLEDYPPICAYPSSPTNCSPGNCYVGYGGTSNVYDNEHDPFVYFADISADGGRCSNIVQANSGGNGFPDDNLLSDLSSTSKASNLMWLTPNLCDDGHNICPPNNNATTQQNNFLSQLVPEILTSNIFTTQKAALFITYDEGSSTYPNDYVTSIWAGPSVKTNYRSSTQYSHYSLLKTIENNWGLQPLNQTTDGQATPMSEFLATPSTSYSWTGLALMIILGAAIGGVAAMASGVLTRTRRRGRSRASPDKLVQHVVSRAVGCSDLERAEEMSSRRFVCWIMDEHVGPASS